MPHCCGPDRAAACGIAPAGCCPKVAPHVGDFAVQGGAYLGDLPCALQRRGCNGAPIPGSERGRRAGIVPNGDVYVYGQLGDGDPQLFCSCPADMADSCAEALCAVYCPQGWTFTVAIP